MERTFQGLILGILIEWKMIRAQSEFSLLEPVAGKILKDMGIPDHLTSLLRYLYESQETTRTYKKLELDMEQQTGSK